MFFFAPKSQYATVHDLDEGDRDGLLQEKDIQVQALSSSRGSTLARCGLWISHGLLIFLALSFFALWVDARSKIGPIVWSPANEVARFNEQLVRFNGTFNHPSPYRGQPTPELDEAWNRISTGIKPTRLTLDQMHKAGYSDSLSKVKFREEDGGGFMASLEVTHQLHCLNMLRKYTYHEYYEKFDPSFNGVKAETFRTHLDHCVEIIRQNLMCSADVAMITYEWVKGFSRPYPDFSTQHKCRNHDNVLNWAIDHEIHIPRAHVSRMPDTVDLETPP